MQRFTLIHDGSKLGWQATYLAFHVSAQLGAPLQVLLVNSERDENILAERATQIEVGGYAAGVALDIQWIAEFSIDAMMEASVKSNGLFVPRRLIPDEKTVRRFLEDLDCPIWFVSKEPETNGTAMLISDLVAQEALINYASILSHRIQQPLTGLVLVGESARTSKVNAEITWHPLLEYSSSAITKALNQVNASLLILPVSSFSLVDELMINCIIYPVG